MNGQESLHAGNKAEWLYAAQEETEVYRFYSEPAGGTQTSSKGAQTYFLF